MQFKYLYPLILLVGPFAQPVVAQDSEQAGPTDTIIVTATRTETSLKDAILPVTVIGRQQIEQSLAKDVAELLRFEAGLDIGRNGGPGQATSLFMRGTDSNHTLVLVDGVSINPGTIGGAPFQHIAPDIIERIEIVKGGRSALYGSNAIGGVVNIITRQSARPNFEVGVGAGSFSSRAANLSGGGSGDKGDFGVFLDWQDTDGYEIRTDSNIKRGYQNLTANIYGVRRFANSDIGIRHWQTSGNVEYLDFFLMPVDQDFNNQSTAVELNNDIGERSASKAILSYFVDDIEQNQSSDFVTSKRLALDWQYTLKLTEHALAGGVYLVDENASASSFGSGFDEDTRINAIFVQDQWKRQRHTTFLALRLTDHDAFDTHATWNAEYRFDLNDAWSFSGGLSHAFRAPDATDRFGFGGNPDLNPEISDQVIGVVRFRPAGAHLLTLEVFRNDIQDLIDFDFSDFTLKNIGEADIRGAKLEYDFTADSFTLRAQLLSQTAEDALTGERLLRRADETLTVNYIQHIGKHRLGMSLLASGEREDFGASLPGYLLVNLTGQMSIGDNWQLNARLENVLDTAYQTAYPYRMQERSVFVAVKYRWQ